MRGRDKVGTDSNLELSPRSAMILSMDWELAWPTLAALLGVSGLMLGVFAVVEWFRHERQAEANRVHVGLAAFATQYALLVFLAQVHERILPTLLMFLIAVCLIVSIALGFRAGTKAGVRILLAASLTALAYGCVIGHQYFQATKIH